MIKVSVMVPTPVSWLMVVATAWVIFILYHREFHSKTLHALVDEDTSTTLRT